ncbi:MAG: sulfite exporter TauE/SafE family protein [Armatimonadota bacterium]
MIARSGSFALGVYALAGVVVGLFSGLFGVGGGILMVPFLLLVAGYTQQQSQAISLAAMVVTALTGAVGYLRGGTLTMGMIPVAAALAIGSIPGATAGAAIAQRLPKTTLSAMFALFIVVMAVRIMPTGGAKSLGLPTSSLMGSMAILVGVLLLAIGVRLATAR